MKLLASKAHIQHRETRPEIRIIELTDLPHKGSSENPVFQVNALTFWIIPPKVFIVHHACIYSSTAMFL